MIGLVKISKEKFLSLCVFKGWIEKLTSPKNLFLIYIILKHIFLIILLPNNGGQRRSNFTFVFIFSI